MKRISLLLLFGLLLNAYMTAQGNDFTQTGKATGELKGTGFVAAHPSRPISSKLMVVNLETGKEAEVTIISRIPSSLNRIIDLSPDVWKELNLSENTNVKLYLKASLPGQTAEAAKLAPAEEPKPVVILTPSPVPAPVEEPKPVVSQTPSPVPVPVEEPKPVVIQTPPPRPASAEESKPVVIQTPPPRPAPVEEPKPVVSQTQTAPYVFETFSKIEVIPGLPNPNTGKVYRLQIGSFKKPENAVRAERMLRNAGFIAAQERYGSFYRVLAIGIPAKEVASAVRRMESLGIKQVWIRQ